MILTGVTEIGEGILTVLTQIEADELDVYKRQDYIYLKHKGKPSGLQFLRVSFELVVVLISV